MQNCGQIKALGETESGTYKVRPNPTIENDIYIYCDHDTDDGGWLILQRRSSNGTLNMTQSWDIYRDGFGNVSTEFWIGNKYLSQLTNHTTYEIMFVFKRTNGSVLRKTKCDAFNVSTEEENFRLQLGTCQGPDAEVLKFSNWSEFSTWDKDNGFGSLNCANDITGWWFGNCDSFINNMFLSCFGASSCEYEVAMMIKPNKGKVRILVLSFPVKCLIHFTFSYFQLMAVGHTGPHGKHVTSHAAEEIVHVFVHVLTLLPQAVGQIVRGRGTRLEAATPILVQVCSIFQNRNRIFGKTLLNKMADRKISISSNRSECNHAIHRRNLD